MKPIFVAIQIVVAFTLFNVWLFRRNLATPYRGGAARNLRDEFRVYGLPDWFMAATGIAKVALAVALLAGAFVPPLVRPVALGIAGLMLGAIAMHVKVADPLRKSLPAASLLVLAVFLAISS